jgi:hypothetical protein
MARLLEGRPDRTEGALTVANLALEAGVSRATANRAADLLAEFRAAEVHHRRSSPQAMKQRIRALEAELNRESNSSVLTRAPERRGAGAELRGPVRNTVDSHPISTIEFAEEPAQDTSDVDHGENSKRSKR